MVREYSCLHYLGTATKLGKSRGEKPDTFFEQIGYQIFLSLLESEAADKNICSTQRGKFPVERVIVRDQAGTIACCGRVSGQKSISRKC